MSLFAPPLHLIFTAAELKELRRPITGDGGGQLLVRALLDTLHETPEGPPAERAWMTVEDTVLQRCYRYAWSHGSGGFQQRLRIVLRAAHRVGWSAP